MSKRTQLDTLSQLGLPTPPYRVVGYADFEAGTWESRLQGLHYPVAVRSSYADEDGTNRSYAGHFKTRLRVGPAEIGAAIREVFNSYGNPAGQEVIVQEMVEADYSGVLFGCREAVWKAEMSPGSGEAVVGGAVTPITLLLPRFTRLDVSLAAFFRRWQPFGRDRSRASLIQPLIHLSWCCRHLLRHEPAASPLGLDIEFAISRGKLYLLQARPITTPEAAEEVLTSANHREILPPIPSQMMTAIIASCSRHLFGYYKRLDPSLRDRDFIEVSGGMPWINLSALLDMMVSWGLPTSLVCDSVGAEDVYRVKLRPWQMLRKWKVFVRVLREQLYVAIRARQWVRSKRRDLRSTLEARRRLWYHAPDVAFTNWLTDMQFLYVELVSHMQALTGAMSGPVKLLDKLGLLRLLPDKSESTEYLEAYRQLLAGDLSREAFVARYGHRGFYESDIGHKRLGEYTESEWAALQATAHKTAPNLAPHSFWLIIRLSQPLLRLMRTREWLRNHAMRYFAWLREELMDHTQARLGKDFDFSAWRPEHISLALEKGRDSLSGISYPAQSGWDMDTFLASRGGRRTHVSYLATHTAAAQAARHQGLGIYPGVVRGQIWRVAQADLTQVQRPDFPSVILLTDSLDPGWIPYFVQADGVLAYVGGLLSHASIILRESQIPAITQLPREWTFQTGDWVEMDGSKGTVVRV
ncbi:MAG: PEP/pyruvate-binding domain-containing protein [Bacteroidia bacterium]|nr:PEP/pyruvate-binding domain-containing protein [Bacteroidia bacterium]